MKRSHAKVAGSVPTPMALDSTQRVLRFAFGANGVDMRTASAMFTALGIAHPLFPAQPVFAFGAREDHAGPIEGFVDGNGNGAMPGRERATGQASRLNDNVMGAFNGPKV